MKNSALVNAPSQERSRQRVALILEVSRRMMAEHGVATITTNSIAAEAGIAVSSIYRYFPNKVAILIAIFEDYLAGVRATYDAFEALDNSGGPWEERLRTLLAMLFQSEKYEGIELELLTAFYLFPELREIDEAHARDSAQRVASILRGWGARGDEEKVYRVAEYLYHMAAAGWTQRLQQPEQREELAEFTHRAAVGLLAPLFTG